MTSSNCCSVILRMVASRVMPALLTMTSSDPNESVAAVSEPRHVVGRGDVAPDTDRVAPSEAAASLALASSRSPMTTASPVLGERAGDRQPDALGASGDHGGASCQHDGPFLVFGPGGGRRCHRVGAGWKFWACRAMPRLTASSAVAVSMPDSIEQRVGVLAERRNVTHGCFDVGEGRPGAAVPRPARARSRSCASGRGRAAAGASRTWARCLTCAAGMPAAARRSVQLRGRPARGVRGDDVRRIRSGARRAGRWWRTGGRRPARDARGRR